ncbi:IQ and ubiquitin-like domain-containing protein [Marchantia polymorpha subsp. ruderalis]
MQERGRGRGPDEDEDDDGHASRSTSRAGHGRVSVRLDLRDDGRIGVAIDDPIGPHRPATPLKRPATNMVSSGVQTREGDAIFPQLTSQTDGLFEVRMKMEAMLDSRGQPRRVKSPAKEAKEARTPEGTRLVVKIDHGDDEPSSCTVYVDWNRAKARLPWRGGYIDKRNGTRLHNAAQQTDPTKAPKKPVLMISRACMKARTKKIQEQGSKDSFTQMDRPGIFLDNSGDYELIPGPYFSAEDWVDVKVDAAIIIQKYTRRDIAKRTAARMRAFAAERKEFWIEQEKKRKAEADDHLRFEIQRRMNPRTGEDFEILYTELATWCAQELKAITATGVTGMERRKAVKELLFKEIKLLQTIDRLRCKAAKENRKDRISGAMEKMSTPKMWEMKNGTIVHVRTLGTARASDLMHLYHALAKPVGTNDERVGVLGYVKWTVQVFNCPLTREILDLVEREADLMNRGRPARTLSGLRQRILNLFLQFVETPDFNPEAAGFQYVPTDFDYGVNQAPTRKPGTDKFT